MSYQENEVLRRLPQHLRQFINDQIYDNYTPVNQAVWRYVMRKNVDYLKTVAHGSYVFNNKFKKVTGISLNAYKMHFAKVDGQKIRSFILKGDYGYYMDSNNKLSSWEIGD